MKTFSLFMTVALSISSVCSTFGDVPVIPRPAKEIPASDAKEKGCVLSSDMRVSAAASLDNEVKFLKEMLQTLPTSSALKVKAATVKLAEDKALPKEGYVMKMTADGIDIKGGSPAGVFYALQSLNQMRIVMGAEAKKQEPSAPLRIQLPAVTLEDAPVCEWRGAMMDSARHFQNKAFVKKFIDAMSVHKLNRLHWHLVDSEGWRLEIKKYPKLTEVTKDFPAEYPGEDPTDKSRPAKFMYGHFHGGGHFTQDDIREIVAFAKSRHIEIMPEIEFPGHAMVALTAYPEFGTTGKPPVVKSNISIDLFSPEEKSLNFLKDILDETMELFPFGVIHFGGDESPKGQWKESPQVQAKIKELGLKDENQLQAWMFNELSKHIAKKGRKAAGWEEIMHGHNAETLTKNSIIMPWLSMENGIKSANAGHGIIHSGTGTFYLDSWQTSSPADNWTLYRGPLTLERIYRYNLFPDALTEEGKKNVLGAQGMLWSELMPRSENVEYQAFPRLAALAELTWTPENRKDYDDFYKRLVDHGTVLDALKLNYRYIDPLPVAKWSPEMLSSSSFTVPLNLALKSGGEMVAQFAYKGGASGLEIKKVELLSGDDVIAEDEHDGMTGNSSQDNAYRLKFRPDRSAKPLSLRVTHANTGKADSRGDITVFTGKGLALFDPRNFAGGDYPSATWNRTDTAKGSASVRIPMDGIVREKGAYDLIFDLKQSEAPVNIAGAKVKGTGGDGSALPLKVALDDKNKKGYVPFTVKDSDMRAGNSLYVDLKSSAPSVGEIRVRRSCEIPSAGEGKYSWNPQVLAGTGIIGYIKSVTPRSDGQLKVALHYKSGGNGMDIRGVQVIQDGKVIAENLQPGFAGGNSRGNEYTFESPLLKKGKPVVIRLQLAGAGGNDSHGTITIE